MNWEIDSVDKKSLYSDHVIRRRDDIADSKTDKCKEFEQGNPDRQEFYSPNYPGNYTSNTECFRILEGRNLFHCICFFSSMCFSVIQNSDCKNAIDGNGLEAE